MDATAAFLNHFHIDPGLPPRQQLAAVARAFTRIPYENITKIIKRAEAGSDAKARRYPAELIADHIRLGAGGTCFSLTAALRQIARDLGWEAEYLLADRSYGANTHSALLVKIDHEAHLLDPGFLLTEPVALASTASASQEIASGTERLALTPEAAGDRLRLSSVRDGKNIYRLTYKTAPVDDSEFFAAWDASFRWDMMRYPLLARADAAGRSYLRGAMLQHSNDGAITRRKIPVEELAPGIAREFHIDVRLVARALALLRQENF